MSNVQEQVAIINQEECISWSEEWVNIVSPVKDQVHDNLIDAHVKFMLGLGCIPIVVGIATGIWPVALAGLGPWLLAWLDTNQRRRDRKQ